MLKAFRNLAGAARNGKSAAPSPGGDDASASLLTSALHCLVRVARHHGVHLTTHEVVHNNVLSDEAVTHAQLSDCAKSAGLRAEIVRADWPALLKLGRALPAIVNLKDGSSMVLVQLKTISGPERLLLQDPLADGDGFLEIDRLRFERVWTGELVLIKRDYGIADETKPMGFGFVLATILRDRQIVWDIAICALVLSILALAPIMFLRLLFDRVMGSHTLNTFTTLCTFMVAIIAFEAVFGAARRRLVLVLTTRVDVKLSTVIFEKVLKLPIDFFEQKQVGYIAFQINEIWKVRNFLIGEALGTLLDSVVIVVFLPVMLFYSPALTAVVVGLCALILLWTSLVMPEVRRRTNALAAAESARNSFMVENLTGIRTVKSLALTARQLHHWDVHVARVAKLRQSQGQVTNLLQTVITPLERLLVSGTLALGVYFAITSEDPYYVGALFAFVLLSQRVASPLLKLGHLVRHYDEARLALESVSRLVNQPPEDVRSESGARPEIRGAIAFSEVTFRYSGAVAPALSDVSFEVPAGTVLGVMGRSGSGKSTIMRLLQRFHSDYSGLIKIDGMDVREYDLEHLRRSMGVVLQDNYLFRGTIRENIAIAKSDATFEEVVQAARLAGAEEFIDKFPRGYETKLYEGSSNLSGGQRQRIAIARALITNPKLLIFDEATSALDAESEAIVNANLTRIAHGRTVIVVSHRLASLVSADAILVLERGRVYDIGRHTDLLDRCDIYGELWHHQNAHLKIAKNKPTALIVGERHAS